MSRYRRILLFAALILCFASPAWSQIAAVTGNLKDLGVNNATQQNTYVQFTLQNFGSNIPRVTGTNAIVSAVSPPFRPNGSGNISGSIQENSSITPANTFYRVCVYYQGSQFQCNNYLINGNFNLNTATPLTSVVPPPLPPLGGLSLNMPCGNAVATPPTGTDTLYCLGSDKNLYYVDSTGRIVGPLGGGGGGGGMVFPQPGVAVSPGTSGPWSASLNVQGTDTSVLTSGTIGSEGDSLCVDANGGATTDGCNSGTITGSLTLGQVATGDTTANSVIGSDNFTYIAGTAMLIAPADTTTPLVINSHSTTQSKALADFNNQSNDTCQGQVCIRGLGGVAAFELDLPLLYISMNDDANRIPILIHNVAAGPSSYMEFLSGNTGQQEIGFATSFGESAVGNDVLDGHMIITSANSVAEFFTTSGSPTSGGIKLDGGTSGAAIWQAALVAGTPNPTNVPIATGLPNALFMTDGGNPQQTSWTLTPAITSLSLSSFGSLTETTAPSGVSSTSLLYAKSVNHWLAFNPNNAGERSVCGSTGTLTSGHIVAFNSSGTACDLVDGGTGTGSGSVTTFSVAADPTPIFTTSVANAGTTPALSFALSTALANKVFANCTSSTATPSYQSLTEGCLPATSVFTDTANTFGAHLNDFSAATIKLPIGAGFATTANGNIGYDTTNKNWHIWENAGDRLLPIFSTTPTNGQCVTTGVSSSVVTLVPGTCTSGVTIQTDGVSNSSQSVLNFTDTAGASGVSFTNPSGGVESATLTSVVGGGNAVVQGTFTGFSQGDVLCGDATPKVVNCASQVGINAQTGTSYTIAGGDGGSSDRGKLISQSNSSASAYTLPQAGTTGFAAGYFTAIVNQGAGAATITPTTSTINGGSTLVLLKGMQANIISDGTNYTATISGYASSTTGTITPGALLAGACTAGTTVTISGATTGMTATASPVSYPGDGAYWLAYVSASNTVTVKVCAAVAETPSASAYNVRLLP